MAVGVSKTNLDILQRTQGWLVGAVDNAVVHTVTSSTVSTYEFKSGGTGGTVQFTIVLTYDDADHTNLVSAVRTV